MKKNSPWAKTPIRMLEIKAEGMVLDEILNKKLLFDFNIRAHLEIWVHYWMKADPKIFRSWQGPRRVDGRDYQGSVYYYLTNKKSSINVKKVLTRSE